MTSGRWLCVIVGACLMCLTAGVAAEVIEETFDDGAARWEPVQGEWRVEDGAYLQTDASTPAYRYCVLDTPLREGSIEVSATALERNDNGNVGASLGVVVKYIDEQNWCVARFGSYGGCSVLISEAGERRRIGLGAFSPEVGRSYRVGAILSDGLLAIVREGVVIAIVEDPFAGQAGRAGLFTETRCSFDDVRIEAIE